MTRPFFSVIVPVLDGGAVFAQCLEALRSSTFDDYELLVVDDGSSDNSAVVAERLGARVLTTGGRQGPGAARNLGAREASGEFLFFMDADCEPHADTLSLAAAFLRADTGVDAIFGSYDERPAAASLVSAYKNLQHHFVHHQGRGEASTFWAGCGAIRRTAFEAAGGFDASGYSRPCIEDIELGGRLREADHRIVLVPEIQVRHHKRWTLVSMVRTDVFDRGIPWTRLMLSRGALSADLNLDAGSRISGVAAWVLLISLLVAVAAHGTLRWGSLVIAAVCAVGLVALNRRFYGFLRRRRGAWFLLRAVPLHWLYFLYSVLAFGLGVLAHLIEGRSKT